MIVGYAITAAVYLSIILTIAFIFLERKELKELIEERTDRYSWASLVIILLFFLMFSILYVSPVEQLYFDENIYQGIAINILNHGNALWCQFGTGYLQNCYINAVYHDPVGWSVFMAIIFAIFGIGTATTYNLELLAGTASIFFFFLLASVLVKKKGYAVVSTLAFSLMPQLFIWSRTQGDVDLAFMMFSTLAFFLFVVFTKRKSLHSLGAFAFSLSLATYMRIEALLLSGVFAMLVLCFSDDGLQATIKERLRQIKYSVQNDTRSLVLLLVFVLVMFPQIYYVAGQAQNPSYGQNAGDAVLSIKNFMHNIVINVPFVMGLTNGISYYPMSWHYLITPLAIAGILFLVFDKNIKNRFGVLAMLLGWFAAYFLFYTAFYAGAATYGVDSRFMLQLLPSTCLLAGFTISGLGNLAEAFSARFARGRNKSNLKRIAFASATAVSCIAFLIVPFIFLVPAVTLPPSRMPQQSVILGSMNYFYNNYNAVPASCLVFSFTPDIWVEVNRSSAQIGYLNGANTTIKQAISQYKCLVIDYGYWCVVPPYHSTLCQYLTTHYQIRNLTVPGKQSNGYSTNFFQILNYS